MKIIEWLSDKIEEEINDGKVYIEKALLIKQDMPKLADTLAKLSDEEYKHMTILHNEVIDIINEYKKTKGAPPSDMMAVYEYLHKKQIEKSGELKALQSTYRS